MVQYGMYGRELPAILQELKKNIVPKPKSGPASGRFCMAGADPFARKL